MRKILIGCALCALMLASCKPTEKNYRSAYDVAISKKQAEQESLAADGLISENAPKPRYIDGDTLYFANEIISVDKDFAPFKESSPAELKGYNVAVGMFKMNTNARAGASALREKGFDAFPVKAVGGKWYIIGGAFENLDNARAFIKEFKTKNPQYPYIGLDGHPSIIRK